jgi:hypothetical protein
MAGAGFISIVIDRHHDMRGSKKHQQALQGLTSFAKHQQARLKVQRKQSMVSM